jgi:predicted acetyltransferase
VLRLIYPTIDHHRAWLDAHLEWGPGLHEDGFGIVPSDELVSTAGFSTWLERLNREELGNGDGGSEYRCLYRWIFDGKDILGGIALRYGDDEFINAAGHIGYGIRPSTRRRGIGTWALAQMLPIARKKGLRRVLLVCEAENAASAATIERNAGTLEGVEETDDGRIRRYWITL